MRRLVERSTYFGNEFFSGFTDTEEIIQMNLIIFLEKIDFPGTYLCTLQQQQNEQIFLDGSGCGFSNIYVFLCQKFGDNSHRIELIILSAWYTIVFFFSCILERSSGPKKNTNTCWAWSNFKYSSCSFIDFTRIFPNHFFWSFFLLYINSSPSPVSVEMNL